MFMCCLMRQSQRRKKGCGRTKRQYNYGTEQRTGIRHHHDVKEVSAGYECGLSLQDFDAFMENDEVESYVLEQEK